MTDSQLATWQRHVLDARRRVEQFRAAGYPTGVPEDAAILAADQELTALRAALAELIMVADLRGDSTLPRPENDPILWTARMQTAWDEARATLASAEEASR